MADRRKRRLVVGSGSSGAALQSRRSFCGAEAQGRGQRLPPVGGRRWGLSWCSSARGDLDGARGAAVGAGVERRGHGGVFYDGYGAAAGKTHDSGEARRWVPEVAACGGGKGFPSSFLFAVVWVICVVVGDGRRRRWWLMVKVAGEGTAMAVVSVLVMVLG
ncbi:putative proline-rich receptor-like protein kinase PERK3 [Iris pallida]|uniref:Proline-rich receptor-like protein kinase PERK3 n=1 Tax=Iris pallida TaxID=29817 RepID=A0AAX6GWR4_IRIPA|nr:putative proline-rich receptor-like protein kinase PERK3 [Iris pallida]KAJ6833197.1 putative proline-rich receptor-like protein kinase PERK3 [Iris pallida]